MRITPSGSPNALIGRHDGVVFYARAGVVVARVVVKPVDKKSPEQTRERSSMISGIRGWNADLTQLERDSWIGA